MRSKEWRLRCSALHRLSSGAAESTVATVLIADNDAEVSSLLADVLVRNGLSVQVCFDGEAASALARSQSIRVLVCDLDMPRASGLEVVESLRALPTQPAVVVISGYLDPGVEARLVVLPFVREILRKPFDLLDFARRVVELAGAQAAEG